ncbi:MAG: RNA polymerase sigma factor [Clostridiales bacterium]|nr:RNA polymerase sigma factor [Clostridiales bacterium]
MDAKELAKQFSKVRSGDKEAFSIIYHDMKTPIYAVVLRIVGSRETAEDITQELFVKLFVSPPDTSIKNPRAWVFQMARNLALDALRKKQHAELDNNASSSDIPVDEWMSMQYDIEKAIMRLSTEEREIVTYYLTIGLSFKEVASIMDLSLSATYRRYRKALTVLREHLQEV